MSRPIWKGHITFGLVNVPVVLYSAEQRGGDLSFHMVDSRNSARIRYERVNEETGAEVPWDKIVKGFEDSKGNHVLLSDDELEHASPKMTRAIEIEQFVHLSDIDIRYFERPYVLVPDSKGEKGYVLLREAIRKAGKAGIAKVVIRARQYLAALIAEDHALVLELLRYDQELIDLPKFDLPSGDLRKYGVERKEIELATKLIEGMLTKWNASKFHDEYQEALSKLVQRKVAAGQTAVVEHLENDEAPIRQTLNFMDVLKRSVASASKGRSRAVTAKSRKSTPRRRTRKRQAG